jgi:rRNA small subunit pseudouridine methyltransferase Nep1
VVVRLACNQSFKLIMLFVAALSWDAPTVKLSEHMPTIPSDKNIVVAIGSMAHGTDDFADAYVDEKISVSDYSLSASVACGKIACAVEELWGIV